MKVTAVITEYNPFHNGHYYQIQEIRKQTGCDSIIIIMSGDFTQRGIPAIAEKRIRTKAALNCGADLVLQLPVLYSCGSARMFAEGAVSILDALGCVDMICYGIEHSLSQEVYQTILDIFATEPDDYRAVLKKKLESGLSFPSARESALFAYLENNNYEINREQLHDFFSSNNILGLEYELALKKLHSAITTRPIPRIGSGYHDLSMDTPYASASGIRRLIEYREENLFPSDFMPYESAEVFFEYFERVAPIFTDDFSQMLYYALLHTDDTDSYLDCSRDFMNKIKNNLNSFKSFTQFTQLLKSKELTHSRISRSLLHIMLNIKEADAKTIGTLSNSNRFTEVNYARILGFRKESAALLSEIQKNTSIPLLSKTADAKKVLNKHALKLFEQDIHASEIYHGIERIKSGKNIVNEYESQIVINS